VPPRYFTLEEATGLLPRLTEILVEMRARRREPDRLRREFAEATARAAGDGHLLERELAEKRSAISDLARQITELGSELKDMDEGLVDFHALREGGDVYLCWRLGEERIAFWHDLETGFAGHQPL